MRSSTPILGILRTVALIGLVVTGVVLVSLLFMACSTPDPGDTYASKAPVTHAPTEALDPAEPGDPRFSETAWKRHIDKASGQDGLGEAYAEAITSNGVTLDQWCGALQNMGKEGALESGARSGIPPQVVNLLWDACNEAAEAA